MKISEILEGRAESNLIKVRLKTLSMLINNFENIANLVGRAETIKKIENAIVQFDDFDRFALLGDNDPSTYQWYEKYVALCNSATQKIQSGL